MAMEKDDICSKFDSGKNICFLCGHILLENALSFGQFHPFLKL